MFYMQFFKVLTILDDLAEISVKVPLINVEPPKI